MIAEKHFFVGCNKIATVIDLDGSCRLVLVWEASKPLDHDFFEGEDTEVIIAFIGWPVLGHVESVVDTELELVLEAVKLSDKDRLGVLGVEVFFKLDCVQ